MVAVTLLTNKLCSEIEEVEEVEEVYVHQIWKLLDFRYIYSMQTDLFNGI